MMLSTSCSNLSSIAKFFLLSTACPGILGPARFRSESPLPCGRADVNVLPMGCVIPGHAAAQSRFSTVLRAGAWSDPSMQINISERKSPHTCGHKSAVTRKKEAVSGSCSEEDDGASGFAWLAREPKLMCGAKGRASSQRSIDYHIPPGPPQQ